MVLGDQIRQARQARGWAQQQLATAAGLSRPTVARVEHGDDVSTATIDKIATALGMHLVLHTNTPTPPPHQ